jgi:hypothetical protein
LLTLACLQLGIFPPFGFFIPGRGHPHG